MDSSGPLPSSTEKKRTVTSASTMEINSTPGRLSVVPLRLPETSRSFPTQIAMTSLFPRRALCSNWRQESPNRMFILGMGFVGQFFAADLKSQGWIVSGTCTSDSKKKKLEEMGHNAYVFDANEPKTEVLDTLKYHTHLLVSIPPLVGIGDPIFQHGKLLKGRLEDGNLQWLCYLSSTSVYGDHGGGLVNEDYPISPTTELGKGRLMAEEGWLNLGNDLGLSVKIFRLGGIYGPGRSAVDTIIKQGPLSELQKKRLYRKYTSRVHVADICQGLNATICKPCSCKILNVVDDDPAPRVEVFKYAWNLVEKKWPGRVKQSTSFDIAEESSRSEKRVSNARMKEELGVSLLYPSYHSGLQNIIEHMDDRALDNHLISHD